MSAGSHRRKIGDLRPGMEHIDLRVKILNLKEPRKVTTHSGFEHELVEGEIEDETGKAVLTVWNEKISQLEDLEAGITAYLKNCFITSFQGVISVNVGRDSEFIKIKGGGETSGGDFKNNKF